MPRKGLVCASFADFGRFSGYFVGMCHVKQSFLEQFCANGKRGALIFKTVFVLGQNSCVR